MVILSQPAALSPAGNIKDFVISGSEAVRFRLYKGENLLLDNQYQPDASGLITVSIKDIVLSSLSVDLPADNIHTQQNIAADFVANISDVNVSFRAIRCGIERWNGDISSFLWGNFLTWQPQLVETRYTQPQWLTYYNASDDQVLLRVKFYLKDGSTSVISVGTVAAGECISFNTQFAHIWSLLDADKYGYYDVYVEDGSGVRLSYIQRYVLVDGSENDTLFIFENTLGGLDSVAFTGANTYAPEHTFGNVVYDECNSNAYIERAGAYSQNSGYKTKREALWLRDFFVMPNRYVVKDGVILPIVVDESSVSNSNMEQLHSFEFKYKLSDDSKYQNLARIETLAVPIEIPTPDNLFFLAPRLAEFERTAPADALLIPVQSPYYEKWYTISYGDIKAMFADIVNAQLKPFAHTHDNFSVISNLSEAEDGSLLYKGEKIGGNSYLGDLATLQSKIEEFSTWFELRTLESGAKILYSKYTLVSEGDQIAGGIADIGSLGFGDGASYNRLDTWENYNASAGDVLSATLGYGLKTEIENIQNTIADGVLSSVIVKLGSTEYKAVNGVVSLPAYPVMPDVPTLVSELQNDAGYITNAALGGYATQSWVQQQKYLTSIPSEYITATGLSSTLVNYQSKITSSNKLDYSLLENTPTIPSAVTESTVSGWGFTKNAGTVTEVKMNGASKTPTNGVIDLGSVITAHQDLSNYATLSDIEPLDERLTIIESNYLDSITQQMVIDALDYTPFDSASFTKANIKSALGIADWALASSKPSYSWDEITSKPTLLSQFTDDVVAGKYLPITGGTLNGSLTANTLVIASQDARAHIHLSRPSGNYITTASGGFIAFIPTGKGIATANADLVVTDGHVYPGTTGVTRLGFGDKRWAQVSSVNGDFSGDLTAGTFKTSSVVACGGRLRINTSNSTTSFGFLKATAYSSALNVGVLDIGSNYGGSATITNEGVDVIAMSMYRGVVGIGRAYTYDELKANYSANIKLSVDGNASVSGAINIGSDAQIAGTVNASAVVISGSDVATRFNSVESNINNILSWFQLRTLESGNKVLYTPYTFVSEGDQIAGAVYEEIAALRAEVNELKTRLASYE